MVDFTLTSNPPRPKLAKYFYGYRYIGYPERFFDYIIDIWVYYIEYIKAYLGYTVILPLEVASNIAEPLVINFSLLFLVILFNTWCVFTVLLISRRVQIMVKEYYFYFIIIQAVNLKYYTFYLRFVTISSTTKINPLSSFRTFLGYRSATTYFSFL